MVKNCDAIDIVKDKLKIEKINEGSCSVSYKVSKNNSKWIFKFIPSSEMFRKFYINDQPHDFLRSDECENKIINALDSLDYIGKVCLYEKNIKINNNKYKKKFKEIYDLIKSSDDIPDKKNASFNLLVLKYIDGVMLEDYIIQYLNIHKSPKESIDFINGLYDKFLAMMKDIYTKIPLFFHGDLHLKNILINKKEELKIIDFGVSCIFTKEDPILNQDLFKFQDIVIRTVFNIENGDYEITEDKIRLLRCHDIFIFIDFTIYELLFRGLLIKDNLNLFTNKLLKSIVKDLLKFKIKVGKNKLNIEELYTNYNKMELYKMVLFNFIRSTAYKRCMEINFIQNVKL